ncbi:hypothetical protein DH2020_008782 [Rehmannia glutinosa]|uniref:Cytochrome P450 protein n=1 Tax=Rehmannia glutinosa TaxID=99300 RepID=A0ABR0X7Q5_REHGL
MLPALIQNIHRFHDYVNEILKESGGTFEFKGPLFGNMDMVITCDPTNIQHIFSKKFSNYPKGPEFRKIFEILGDGIFNADFELWELHRRTTLSLMSSEKFYSSLERSVWQKVETGLIPVFDKFLEQGFDFDFDLQHIIQRFAFDNICQLMLNYDPGSLSPDLPEIRCERALSDALEPLLHRHILPETVWKVQKWLEIGNEKKLLEAWEAFDDFIYPRISLEDNNSDNIFEAFTKAYHESENIEFSGDLKHFLRDTFLNLLVAGRDSLSTGLTWFFWLISKNPSVEIKIREEIETVLQINEKWRYFSVEESHKLVYLQAALFETIRLFPPIALEHKVPIEPDVLPGGNVYVDHNTKVIISFYSTGRMESVWGKDCLEFKPDRWILPGGGGVRHESAFKFPVFNAGPRTCLGKKMAIIEMKMVAAFIVYHFQVHVIEGHPVSPRDAVILHAKHGLRVRLSRIRNCIKA